MLHCFKFLHHPADHLHGHTDANRNRRCRHHILVIMPAKKLQIADIHQRFFLSAVGHLDLIPLQIQSLRERPGTAKKNHLRLQLTAFTEFPKNRILIVQYHTILSTLIRRDPFLDLDIILHGPVTI